MFVKIFNFLKTLTMFAKILKFLKTLTMFAEFLKILRNFDYVCRVFEKFGTKSHNEKKSLNFEAELSSNIEKSNILVIRCV